MNVNNSNIQKIYQWLIFSSMTKMMQRMKRALRSKKKQTHFIFLYFSWCIKIRNERTIEKSIKFKNAKNITSKANNEIEIIDPFENEHKKIIKKSASDRRRDLSWEIWDLINVDVKNRCHKKIALKFYHDVKLND